MDKEIDRAKSELDKAEALLITTGAGMGVDSGLPDFRGTQGFWKAYPPYKKLGLEFMTLANPKNFYEDPAFGWGFYGHRFNLYQATEPHEGYRILLDRAKELPGGGFAFTSNVDGHFQKAGFDEDQVLECHGSINYHHCLFNCTSNIYPSKWEKLEIDESTMRAREPLPTCPECGQVARPAILMFGDLKWNDSRFIVQESHYQKWLDSIADKRLVIIEMGAGTGVPTVRKHGERISRYSDAFLIRINPREPKIPPDINGAEIPGGALKTLRKLF